MLPPSLEKNNPYNAPGANLDPSKPPSDHEFVPEGRSVDSGRVMDWYGKGWEMFKMSPGVWILISLIFIILMFVMAMIPLVNMTLYIVFPIFFGGLMLGCAAQDHQQELRVDHLFAGFQNKFGPLALVGLLYMAAFIVVTIICGIIIFVSIGAGSLGAIVSNKSEMAAAMMAGGIGMGFLLVVLVSIALTIPLVMAVWFAPVLVVLHDMGPLEAMKASFSGCMKNILPFLLYGILYIVFAIIATLFAFLGWFVLGPVIIGSIYASYKDIYLK